MRERLDKVKTLLEAGVSPPPTLLPSTLRLSIPLNSTIRLFAGSILPENFPPLRVDRMAVVAGTVQVSQNRSTWTTYNTGEQLPYSGDIRSIYLLLRSTSSPPGVLEIYFSFTPPQAPKPLPTPANVGEFSYEVALPEWWKDVGDPTFKALWESFFGGLDLSVKIQAIGLALLDPYQAPLAPPLERIYRSPDEYDHLSQETRLKALRVSRLADLYRGTEWVYPILFHATGLGGGVGVYWSTPDQTPWRREIIYSGPVSIEELIPLLRAYTPAHIEILLRYLMGFPPQTGFIWTAHDGGGLSWTFNEREEGGIF